MAKEIINVGDAPNDGTGDALRSAFLKTQSNFDELYQTTADLKDDVDDIAGKIRILNTFAEIANTTISSDTSGLKVLGRNVAGDNKGSYLKRVSAGAVLNNARAQSLDGAKWEIYRPDGVEDWYASWFGASESNTGAQNDSVWASILTVALPGEGVVWTKFTTGIFNFTNTIQFYPLQLIGEGEIILAGSVLGNSVNTIVKKGKITLQNTHATVGWKIGFTRVIDPGSVDIKHDYVDYQEVDDSEPYPLTFTAGATVKDLSFYSCPNNSDTWSALSAGVTVSGDLATFNFSAQPTNSWLAAFDEAPEVGSYYSCGAGPGGFLNMQAIFVKTENSYRAVVQDASNDMGINQVEKVTSVSNVTTAVTPLSTADMPAFYLRNSTLAIYITKYNEYIIAQNGVTIVGPIRTPNGEAITAVGWGFYNQAFTFTCGLLHPTKTRRPRPPAPRPMKIVCFGDSLTDPAVPGWPEHMTAALQGSNGSQVEQVINTAISGNTSTQQLTALTALDKTGVTLAVGMIGVNDAQQGFNSSSFKANILAIADLFKAVGAPVVFVTAHAYYSQVQAAVFGGKGGVTLNQESGSVYRESMKWAAAQAIIANSVPSKVIDITSVVPPALTKYLDWSSSVHYGARAEPVVYDNVHFHMKARTYLGRAAAIGALGLLCPKARRGVEPLPVLSTWMRNSWTQASNWQSFWWIDAQGVKHLKCFLIGGSTIADGTIAIQLPTMLRPANPNINPRGGSILDGAYSPGSPNASLQMAIDGSLKVFAVDASTKFFSFEIAYV